MLFFYYDKYSLCANLFQKLILLTLAFTRTRCVHGFSESRLLGDGDKIDLDGTVQAGKEILICVDLWRVSIDDVLKGLF